MKENITVSLTGPFAVRVGYRRQKLRIAGNTKRLLMLLAANFNHGLRRESLVADIWPRADAQHGASALSSALWRLKSCLEPIPGLEIHSIDDIVRLSVTSPASVDVAVLEQAVGDAESDGPELTVDARAAVISAVKLCNGPILEGCDDHWALPMRERCGAHYIRALLILMRDAATHGAVERALEFGREILVLDPFREGTQREVMRLYVQNGQRVRALRQYEVLRRLLRQELGIEPMPETASLHARISGNDLPAPRNRDEMPPMRDKGDTGRPTTRP